MAIIQFDNGMRVEFDGTPTSQDIEEVYNELTKNKIDVKEEPKKKGLGQKVLDAGSAVANFVGAKGISEQFGASLARVMAPKEQEAFVENPTLKEVTGSALQTGANLIPGAGVGAKLATKVGVGAITGYGIDVGGKLQQKDKTISQALKPGVGTLIGTTLPLLGKITGLSNIGNKAANKSKQLEELNLRLTPVEKQNLVKQGKDIVDYLAKKKIVGTPEQRFSVVNKLYDDMENKIQSTITKTKGSLPTNALIDELKTIPEKYVDNLSEFDSIVSKIDRVINTLKKNYPNQVPISNANKIKRAEFQNAFSKNNTDVINEASFEIGDVFRRNLEKSVKGLKDLNKEYSLIIPAKRALFKATTRNQSGLIGRAVGLTAGTSIGAGLGGGVGAAAGAFIGERAANVLSTPIRSARGAMNQKIAEIVNKIPVDKRGNVLLGRKTLMQLLMQAGGDRD